MVISWIYDSLYQLEFEEKAFLNVIFRDIQDSKELQEENDDKEKEEGASEEVDIDGIDDYELVYEDDYEFKSL